MGYRLYRIQEDKEIIRGMIKKKQPGNNFPAVFLFLHEPRYFNPVKYIRYQNRRFFRDARPLPASLSKKRNENDKYLLGFPTATAGNIAEQAHPAAGYRRK